MTIIKLQEANCRNCHHCVRACPTKTISFARKKPEILEEECLHCGKCYLVCPHDAKKIVSDFSEIKQWINNKEKVILSIAPSFVEVWQDYPLLKKKLLQSGFYDVEETAIGASHVSSEFANLIAKKEMKNIITTCCPVVVTYVERYFPDLIGELAPVVSPMIAHGKLIKEKHPDAKVVFVTPCIAKIHEAKNEKWNHAIDGSITMEELYDLVKDVTVETTDDAWPMFEGNIARYYPVNGGVCKTLPRDHNGYNVISIDGLERIKEALVSIQQGHLEGYFIEMNACVGSCMAGPLIQPFKHNEWIGQGIIRKTTNRTKVDGKENSLLKTAYQSDEIKKSEFTERQIQEVLHSLGKYSIEDELDCEACGYATCRQKAIAVLEGKADPDLCLPHAIEEAKSISNLIIEHTPNGILVLNDALEIKEINPAAMDLLNCRDFSVVDFPILSLLPSDDLDKQLRDLNKVEYYVCEYPLYQKVMHHAMIPIKEQKMIVIILRDLTEEKLQQKQMKEYRQQTMMITQQVIDEQMRTVQEIASLLGETTAKSKIALTRLKKSVEES